MSRCLPARGGHKLVEYWSILSRKSSEHSEVDSLTNDRPAIFLNKRNWEATYFSSRNGERIRIGLGGHSKSFTQLWSLVANIPSLIVAKRKTVNLWMSYPNSVVLLGSRNNFFMSMCKCPDFLNLGVLEYFDIIVVHKLERI